MWLPCGAIRFGVVLMRAPMWFEVISLCYHEIGGGFVAESCDLVQCGAIDLGWSRCKAIRFLGDLKSEYCECVEFTNLQHAKKMRAYASTQTARYGTQLLTSTSSPSRPGGSDAVQLCWLSHVCEDALPPSIDIVLPVGSVG